MKSFVFRTAAILSVVVLLALLWLNHAMLKGTPHDARVAFFLLAGLLPAAAVGACLEIGRAYLSRPEHPLQGVLMVVAGAGVSALLGLTSWLFY
jgi:peptidoglycan/LPS O-acetylase OafA/YrhL